MINKPQTLEEQIQFLQDLLDNGSSIKIEFLGVIRDIALTKNSQIIQTHSDSIQDLDDIMSNEEIQKCHQIANEVLTLVKQN